MLFPHWPSWWETLSLGPKATISYYWFLRLQQGFLSNNPPWGIARILGFSHHGIRTTKSCSPAHRRAAPWSRGNMSSATNQVIQQNQREAWHLLHPLQRDADAVTRTASWCRTLDSISQLQLTAEEIFWEDKALGKNINFQQVHF